MVINDFVSAMQSKDHEALAACFAEECRLFDYCPSVVKRQNSFLFGRNAIEMYYHNKFMFGGFGMLDPRVVNERTVNFYADRRLVQPRRQPDQGAGDQAGVRGRRPFARERPASPVPAGRSLFSGPHGERAPRVCQGDG